MQKDMKNILFKPVSKAIVDILLLVGLFFSIMSSRQPSDSWGSLHCIVSMAWYALMLVHIAQHWRLTKALLKWNVLKRNKITFLVFVVFILMTFSVISFMVGVSEKSMRIHHAIAHIFWAVMIIHAIAMTKRFKNLFNGKRKATIQKKHINFQTPAKHFHYHRENASFLLITKRLAE
jgi:hypothetical protein